MAAEPTQAKWSCARCEVTVRYMPGSDQAGRPPAWVEDGGQLYCLACRREIAAEVSVDEAPADTTAEKRAQIRSGALVEFEIKRDPSRSDGEIARAIRSSVFAVQKARKRIG